MKIFSAKLGFINYYINRMYMCIPDDVSNRKRFLDTVAQTVTDGRIS